MSEPTRPIDPRLLKQPAVLLASGFGTGLSPVAPGTVGTLVGVALYLALAGLPLAVYLALVAGIVVVGLWACGEGGRILAAKDHPGMVMDEIAGFLVAMTAVPPSWQSVLLGFVLFRLFDIFKPWPIRALERGLQGGAGVMLDDLMAGLYTLATLHVLRHAFNFP